MNNYLLTFDNKYMLPCLVTLKSIVLNITEPSSFFLVSLDCSDSIKDFMHKKIKKIFKKTQHDCQVIVLNDPLKSLIYSLNSYGWNHSIFIRMFSPFFLDNIDNLMYVDSDIIVKDNRIEELYNQCVNHGKTYPIIGSKEKRQKRAVELFLKDHFYINSGLLFLNIKPFRDLYPSANSLTQSIQCLNNVFLKYPDQDLLNILFDCNKGFFDKDIQYIPWDDSVLENQNFIYHYADAPKPWDKNNGFKRNNFLDWYKYAIGIYSIGFCIKSLVLFFLCRIKRKIVK